jgi:hypothetical protein
MVVSNTEFNPPRRESRALASVLRFLAGKIMAAMVAQKGGYHDRLSTPIQAPCFKSLEK